ncbi:MAG: hypothetical protein JJE52_18420 [Acidimicrobiia bacterium]|nr:hypothetical protein [Acidimicrobiia bacterium]
MTWDSYETDPLGVELGAEEHTVRFVPGLMFHNDEADAAALEDGYTSGPDQLPNGYYIRDLEIGPVVLPVSAGVTPLAFQYPDRIFETTWEAFAAVYDGQLGGETPTVMWWPVEVVVVDDRVVGLRQIYLP